MQQTSEAIAQGGDNLATGANAEPQLPVNQPAASSTTVRTRSQRAANATAATASGWGSSGGWGSGEANASSSGWGSSGGWGSGNNTGSRSGTFDCAGRGMFAGREITSDIYQPPPGQNRNRTNPHFRIAMMNLMAYAMNPKTASRPEGAPDENDDPNSLYMIVDSGANMNFVHRNDVLCDKVLSQVKINGLGPQPILAEYDGLLLGYLHDDQGNMHGINTVATSVPNTSVSLWSVGRAVGAGHSVIHEGDPEHGRHGLVIKDTGAFIPFIWCPRSRLWWIRLSKSSDTEGEAHVVSSSDSD